MASISYVKAINRWRVRWRATNRKLPQSNPCRVFSGSDAFIEKEQAYRKLIEMESQEKLWRSGDVAVAETISHAVDEYRQHSLRFTDRTQGHYQYVVDQFIESLPGLFRFQQIAATHIQEYVWQMRDRKVTNRTINSHLTVIKSLCRFMANRYGLNNVAIEVAMLTEDPPNARFLTPQEFKSILAVANDLQRDRALFLANTGLRASEFAALTARNRLAKTMESITLTGKGRKRRTIPLNQTCKEILGRDLIHRRTTRNALGLSFDRLAKKAKVPKFGPHALRHYFATQLLLRGVPIIKVSKLLGHASVATTERCYAHILSDDLMGSTDVLT